MLIVFYIYKHIHDKIKMLKTIELTERQKGNIKGAPLCETQNKKHLVALWI